MDITFTGNDWTFYAPHNPSSGLNIVSGVRAITSRILHVILTRKGEDPIHPSLGIAPDLFQPLSTYEPRYLAFHLEEAVMDWNDRAKIGIGAIAVGIVIYEERYTNGMAIEIQFTPEEEDLVSTLTFGYWEYLGAVHERSLQEFLDGIQLDGQQFRSLVS
jgi:hypothetical protein